MTDAYTELDSLKEKAAILGIKVPNNISIETLKQKINEVETAKNTKNAEQPKTEYNIGKKIRDDKLRLIRVKITCLDPAKKGVQGEIFTVANKYIGNVSKFVPFNCDAANAYHLPYCIYEQVKDMKYVERYTQQDRTTGREIFKSRLAPAYHLEILPSLNQEELNKLAEEQKANRSFERDASDLT